MGTKVTRHILIALIAAFATVGASFAWQSDQSSSQTTTTTTQTHHHSGSMTSKMSDEPFAKKAAEGGLAEVKLGQLAQEKGSSQAVKDFGKRMVDDHTKANDQLKDAASKANITLPTDVGPKEQAMYDRLSKLSGAQFDHAYATEMVKDHSKDVREFRHEANSGENQDIKSFASQTLPTLEEHLKLARDMAKQVSSGSTGQAGSR